MLFRISDFDRKRGSPSDETLQPRNSRRLRGRRRGGSRDAEAPLSKAAAAVAPAKPRSDNILVRLYHDMSEDRLFPVAAGVAFYGLLSLVPSLAAAVSLFGLFADPERLARLPDVLTTMLPAEAVKLVQGEAQRLVSQGAPSLSLKLGFAVALSLWSASAAVRALFDALNVIDEQQETRSILRLYATALAVTLGGVVVLSLAVALIGAEPGVPRRTAASRPSRSTADAGRRSSASP